MKLRLPLFDHSHPTAGARFRRRRAPVPAALRRARTGLEIDRSIMRIVFRMIRIAIRDYRDYRRLVMEAKKQMEEREQSEETQQPEAPITKIDPSVLTIGPTEQEVLSPGSEAQAPGPQAPGPMSVPKPEQQRMMFELGPEACMLLVRGPFDTLEAATGNEGFRLSPQEEKGLTPYMMGLMKCCSFNPEHFKWIALLATATVMSTTMGRKIGDARRAAREDAKRHEPESVETPGGSGSKD